MSSGGKLSITPDKVKRLDWKPTMFAKKSLLISFAVALNVSGVWATDCASGHSPTGPPVNAFALALRIRAQTLRLGDPVEITLELRNAIFLREC